jgi:predicted site-specific integrase-resolvase
MISRTPALLQAYQAAQLFGISLGTLNYWSRRGMGPPSILKGNRYWYPRSALQDWLRNGGASQLVRSAGRATIPR